MIYLLTVLLSLSLFSSCGEDDGLPVEPTPGNPPTWGIPEAPNMNTPSSGVTESEDEAEPEELEEPEESCNPSPSPSVEPSPTPDPDPVLCFNKKGKVVKCHSPKTKKDNS